MRTEAPRGGGSVNIGNATVSPHHTSWPAECIDGDIAFHRTFPDLRRRGLDWFKSILSRCLDFLSQHVAKIMCRQVKPRHVYL